MHSKNVVNCSTQGRHQEGATGAIATGAISPGPHLVRGPSYIIRD